MNVGDDEKADAPMSYEPFAYMPQWSLLNLDTIRPLFPWYDVPDWTTDEGTTLNILVMSSTWGLLTELMLRGSI